MTNKPFLPYGKQIIDDDDIEAVVNVLRGDFLTTGPAVETFETALAEVTAARYAIACSSGTAGLWAAAMAAGIGPGDQVVVPAITFLATASAPHLAGAEILFADVDPETGLMEAPHLEEALARSKNSSVKAVFPVHYGGQSADMPGLKRVADKAGAIVIEDACHALGTVDVSGVPIGSCPESSMAVFSFHPVKTCAMGEGGGITTNDPELAKKLRLYVNHGMTRDASEFANSALAFDASGTPNPWYYEMVAPSHNLRASDIHCALGSSQLKKLDRFVKARTALVSYYDRLLTDVGPAVMPIRRRPSQRTGWHLYPVLIDFGQTDKSRSSVMADLKAKGVGTQVHYIPVSRQPYYMERYGALHLPGAEAFYERELSLPLFPSMTEKDVERVVTALREILGV